MWRLFRQFILRPLIADRIRTATTIAGIALGIAVVIAIQLTNDSSVRGFARALETTAGRASVEIVGTGVGIDETLMPSLTWLREFGVISPVIQGEMALVGVGGAGRPGGPRSTEAENTEAVRRPQLEAVRAIGIDILRDQPIRDYQLAAHAPPSSSSSPLPSASDSSAALGVTPPSDTPLNLLDLLTDPRSVVITEKLALRRNYTLGGEITLMAGDRVTTYSIRGLLKDEGPARVLDGNFVLMDIAAAQLAFDRLGRLDRVDVLLAPGRGVDEAVDQIERRLPAGLHAQRPSRRSEQVETMLAAFHLNLTALSWIALIVGLFLVYNTVTISVVARREEIGTLRALGVTRRRVLTLFLGEAAALAAIGVAIGLVLARFLADAALGFTSSTVRTLYIASAAAPPAMDWSHIALAIIIGLPLSLLAAAVPAIEASRVPPTSAIRGHDRLDMRVRLRATSVIAPVLTLALAAGLARLGPVNGRPLFGYLSSFVLIAGASLLVPAIMFGLARLGRASLRRRLGVEGLLAHSNLTAAIPRLSISVSALAASLSMMVAIAVMIGSFRDTVVYWVGQTLQADLFIGPGVRPTVGSEQTVSPDVIDAVSRHPDVVAVDSFRNVDLVYNHHLSVLGAASFDVTLSHGAVLFKSPADARERLRDAIGQDAVIISEPFATRNRKRDGDVLTLDTPSGSRDFRVAAVYYDYSNDRGVVVMDRRTFVRHFGELSPTGVAAYVRDGVAPEQVREELLSQLPEGHRVFIYTNRALRDEVLRVFDSTFAITYALEFIAIVVGMLGVAGTLLTLVLERRRELVLLRLTGADRRQVRRMVVIEAALIGTVSQGIGLVVGFALSVILIYVINVQSFGWTIQFHVPLAFLVQASIVVVIATALAGIYPAHRAARLTLTHEE